MYKPLIIYYLLLCFFISDSIAQVKNTGVPYIKNYTIDDYSPAGFRASPQNWEIFQDNKEIMYFGNTDGLLIFDGNHWRLKFLPNRSIVRSINTNEKNRIFVGGENEFGELIFDPAGNIHYRSFMKCIPDSVEEIRNVWGIDTYRDTIVFRSRNKLFFYYKDSIYKVIRTPFQFFHHFKYRGDLYVFEAGKGLMKLKNGRLQLIPHGEYFKNHTAWAIFPFGSDRLLFASPVNGLSIYHNKKFKRWNIPASDFLSKNRIYCGVRLPDGKFAFGTQGAGIVIMDTNGRIVQRYNKDNGLQNNVVLDLATDKKGNLWAALTNGISYLNLNSPFTYYTSDIGIPRQNYYVTKYQDNLFFSNDEGIYVKPFRDLSDKLEINKAELLPGTEGQSWLFQRAGPFLLCGHNAGVTVIKDDKVHQLLNIPVNVWQVLPDPSDPTLFYACSIEGLYLIKLKNNDVYVENFIQGYKGNVIFAEFDQNGYLWVSDEIHGIKRLSFNEEKDSIIDILSVTRENGLPSDEGNWINKLDGEIIITNPSEQGFFYYNEDIERVEAYRFLNERFRINGPVTLVRKGPLGNYWIRDGGLLKVFKQQNDSLRVIEKPFLKFKGRNLERLSFADSTIAFFGTDEYVLNYYLKQTLKTDISYKAHIREVKSLRNDSIIFNGHYKRDNYFTQDPPRFSYNMNALRFDFSATFFEEPENIKFLTWLEGYEDKPNLWVDEHKKEYTNLREGDYVFHVMAKNIYGTISEESIYPFSIDPPWYRTIYAYFVYIILIAFLLYVGVRLYVKKLKADKDRLERIVKQRTSEIQQQKEELSAQAEELERINKELQKLSLVASKTDNAVIIADASGKIEWINEGFVRLFGYSFSELKNSEDGNLHHFGSRKKWSNYIEEVTHKRQSAIFESELNTATNKRLNVQTTLTPIMDNNGAILNLIAITTDITNLKETQRELHKLIATKDKFFSIIAHDLKNPFHSLMGISELLVNNHRRFEEEKLKELYIHLYKVTHQGYQLLTNLLEWARSQTGRLQFAMKKVNIAGLIDETLDLVQATAKEKGVEIQNMVSNEFNVLADEHTIKTVIRNLVSNAVKYSEKNSKVKITGESLNDYVKIAIEDNGVGISPEDMGKLFRIDMNFSTRGTENEMGTGLGLILCKEFVEKNKGKIYVESVLGKGSTFSFTLQKTS